MNLENPIRRSKKDFQSMQSSTSLKASVLARFSTFTRARSRVRGVDLESAEVLISEVLSVLELKRFSVNAPLSQVTQEVGKRLGVSSETQSFVTDFFTNESLSQANFLLISYILALKADGCSESTVKNYRSDISQFFTFANEIAINKIFAKPKVQAFLREQKAKGLAKSSIKRKLISLTQMAIWMELERLVPAHTFSWLIQFGDEFEKVPATAFATATANLEQNPNNQHKNIEKIAIKSYNKLNWKPFVSGTSLTAANSLDKASSETQKGNKALKSQERRFEIKSGLYNLRSRFHDQAQRQILPYLNLMLSLILFLGMAYFGYMQIFGNVEKPLAYPTALTRPNRTLSFQGRLTDTSQNPITTASNLRFKLYDSGPSTSGGTLLWDSNTCSVTPDQDGIFAVGLGADCGSEIDNTVFSENANVWLQVQVGAETLSPRQSIKSVAYALNSETLQGYPASASAVENTIPVMNNSGQIVLGNASPVLKSTSGTFAIEAQTLMIKTSTGSNGNITLDPDSTGKINLLANVDVDGYIKAPGATLSATYAGGTALVVNGGPSGTADIVKVQDSTGTTLSIFNSAGNLGLGTTSASQKLDVAGAIRIGAAGSNNTLDTSAAGGSPTGALFWGDRTICDSSGTCAGFANFWRLNLGTISPVNDTLDFLVGSNATASAKFAVLNVNNGTPNASISSGVSGNSSYLTADGTLGTARRQSLIIGNSSTYNTTGNVLINPNNTGNVAIGTTAAGSKLDIFSPSTNTDVQRWMASDGSRLGRFTETSGGAGWFEVDNSSGTAVVLFRADSSTSYINAGNFGIGTTAPAPGSLIDVAGYAAAAGATLSAKTSGEVALTIKGGPSGTADLARFSDSTGSILSVINSAGNIGIGTTSAGQKLDVAGAIRLGTASANNVLNTSSGSTPTANLFWGDRTLCDSSGSCGSTFANYWRINLGTISDVNDTLDLLVGSNATASAKFAVLNVNNGTPNASVSSGVSGNSMFMTADGSLSTTRRASLTIGNSSTYNTTGNVLINSNGTGNVGIGNTAPTQVLDVNGNLRVRGNNITDSADTTRITLGATTTLTNTTTTLSGTTTLTASSLATFTTASSLAMSGTTSLTLGSNSTINGGSAANDDLTLQGTSNGTRTTSFVILQPTAGNVGIGSTTPSQVLDVAGAIRLGAAGAANVLNTSVGSTPTGNLFWGDRTLCDSSGSCSPTIGNYWRIATGDISPVNDTLDFMIGSNATASAKFAVLNVNNGTPNASVSSGVSGNSMFMTADGSLSTTRRASLTIGNSSTYNTTGNVLINSNGTGNVGIGNTAPTQVLDVNGSLRVRGNNISDSADTTRIALGATTTLTNTTTTLSGTTTLTASSLATFTTSSALSMGGTTTLTLGSNSTINGGAAANDDLTLQGTSNGTRTTSYVLLQPTAGNVGIGTTAPNAQVDMSGYLSAAGATLSAKTSGETALTLKAGPSATADIARFQNSAGSTLSIINSAGNFGVGTTTAGQKLDVAGAIRLGTAGANNVLNTSAAGGSPTGALFWGDRTICDSSGTCAGFANFWRVNLGTISPVNDTLDFLVGSNATASAKFAVLNVNNGTPNASISSGVSGNSSYLTADGTLSTSRRQSLTIGNSSTYNTTGDVLIQPNGTGNVAIGTTAAASKLDVNGTTTIRYGGYYSTLNQTNGSEFRIETNYTDLVLNTPATMHLQNSGSDRVSISNTTTTVMNNLKLDSQLLDGANSAGTSGYLLSSTGSTVAWIDPATVGTNYWRLNLGTISPVNDTLDMFVGSNATASAKFAVLNVNNGTPNASISSGVSGNSAFLTSDGSLSTTRRQSLIIGNSSTYNTTGNVLLQANGTGNVGIGTTSTANILDVAGNINSTTGVYKLGNNRILTASNGYSNLLVGVDIAPSMDPGVSRNTLIGYGVGAAMNDSNASQNTVVGYSAGSGITSGAFNTIFGAQAGGSITSGYDNVIIGDNTDSSSTGYDNVFIGHGAGDSTGAGNENIVLGAYTDVTGGKSYSTGLGTHVDIAYDSAIGIGYNADPTAAHQLVIGGNDANGYINDAYFGRGVVSATPNDIVFNATGGSGTNIAGANFTLAGGKATGNADGGDIIFQTADVGSTGATLQSLTEKMRLTDEGNLGIGTSNPSNFKLQVAGSIGPQTDNTYDLGSSSFKWANVYATAFTQNGNTVCDSSGNCGSGANFWRIASGAISDVNDTLDLLVGSNATASAKFAVLNVNNGTPTASISSGVSGTSMFMRADGSLSTTRRQSLTIGNASGNDTTGNILINPNGSGNIAIGTTDPFLNTRVSLRNSGSENLLMAVTYDTGTPIQIQQSGSSGYGLYVDITNGAGSTRGIFVNQEASAYGLRINDQSNDTTPFIVDENGNVGISTSSPINFQLQVNGNIGPDATETYNLGSDSYRWNDLYLGGDTLHIGTSTTDEGTISYNTTSNVLGISTDSTTNGDIAFFTNNLYLKKSSANVGIGTTAPGAKLDVAGYIGAAGATLSAKTSGEVALTVKGGPSGTADLARFSDSTGSILSIINSAGNVGVGTTSAGQKLDVAGAIRLGAASANNVLNTSAGSAPTANLFWGDRTLCDSSGSCGGSFTNYWRLNLGTISPVNDTLDMFVGSNATASAKFAVLNVNNGTPNASVSSGVSGTSMFMTADGTLSTRRRMALTIGNSSTYNTTGDVLLQSNGTGNVGIGTTQPGAKFEIYGSAPFSRVTNSANSYFVDFGFPAISGGEPSLSLYTSGVTNGRVLQRQNSTKDIFIGDIDANSGNLHLRTNGNDVGYFNTNGNFGIGTSSPVGKVDVAGYVAAAGATLSAKTSGEVPLTVKAGPSATGDIARFTNSSGTVLDFINSAGNFGIGTTTAGTAITASGGVAKATAATTWISTITSSDSSNQLQLQFGLVGDASATNRVAYIQGVEQGVGYRDIMINPLSGAGGANVGIGTSAANQKLDVNGAVRLGTAGAGNVLNTSSGSAPTGNLFWGNRTICDSSGSCSTANYWRLNLGTISPVNDTLDFIVGSNATASAKFAVLNVNNGTPNASISSGVSGNSMFMTADGSLSTTRRQSLNIGNTSTYNTTGNVFINPNGAGNVAIGTTAASAKLVIAGSSDATQFILKANGTQSNSNPLMLLTDSGGTELLRIHSDHITNTFMGNNAGNANTTGVSSQGQNNSFFGSYAGGSNTTGENNTAVGSGALTANSTGTYNTAVGLQAMFFATAGFNNAFGVGALSNSSGSDNVAMGVFALTNNTSGQFNTAVGNYAGYSAASNAISGNTLIGYNTGFALTSGGDNNTIVGYLAGTNVTSGAGNIIIGYNVNAPSAGGSNQLNIGNSIYGNVSTGNIGISTSTVSSFKLTTAGSIGPSANNTYDLGASGTKWANVYATSFIQNGNTVCDSSGNCGSSTNYWRLNLGTVSPTNDTLDLLIGSNATASAKFAVLNVNNGTPIASISSGVSGNSSYLTADGTLGTQNRQALTIGNSSTYNTTGDVLINPNGTGNVGIGTTAPGQALSVNGNIITSNGNFYQSYSPNGTAQPLMWITSTSNGQTKLRMYRNANTTSYADWYWDTSNNRYIIADTVGTSQYGGILMAPSTGTTLSVTAASSGTQTKNYNLTLQGEYWNGSASVSRTATIVHNITATTPTSQLDFGIAGSTLMTLLDGGNLGVGTTIPTQILDVNGNLRVRGNNITDSADTTRLTLGGTTTLTNTTTTLSGTTTLTASSLATFTTASSLSMGSTTTLTLGGNGTINGGSASNDDLTLQGTSNATRTTSYVLLQPTAGNVGIANSSPAALFSVGSSSQFQVNSSGYISSIGGVAHSISDSSGALQINANSTANLLLQTNGGNVAIGTTAPLGALDINGFASAAGATISSKYRGNAALILNGQEYTSAANASTEGVALVLGVNRNNNRQLWIGDTTALGSSTLGMFRYQTGSAMPSLDAVTGDGNTRLPVAIGTSTTNVLIGPINTTTPGSKLSVAGNLAIGTTYYSLAAPTDGAIIAGNVGIGTSSPNAVGGGGRMEIYNTTAGTNDAVTVLNLTRASSGTPANNIGARLEFNLPNASGTLQEAATINTILTDVTAGSIDSAITFHNRLNSSSFQERMRIAADGNVAIGTTTAGSRLDVKLGTDSDYLRIQRASATGRSQIALADQTGTEMWRFGTTGAGSTDFAFYNGSTNILTMQQGATGNSYFQGGNVGVGTSVPVTKLQVGSEVIDDNSYAYTADALMVVNQTPTSTTTLNDPQTVLTLARQGTAGQAYGAAANFNLSRYVNNSTNSRTRLDISLANGTFDANSNTIMSLFSSGNVSIGTTTNGLKKLEVNTTASTDGIAINGTTNPALTVMTSGTTRGEFAGATATNAFFTGSAANDTILRAASGTNMLLGVAGGSGPDIYIDSTHNVGIGTTNPISPFQLNFSQTGTSINGNASARIYNSSNTQNNMGALIFDFNRTTVGTFTGAGIAAKGTASADDVAELQFYVNNGTALTQRMTLNSAGNLGVGVASAQEKIGVLDDDTGVNSGGIRVQSTSGEYLSMGLKNAGNTATIIGQSQLSLGDVSNSDTLFLKSGNVGVGNTTAGALLDVGAAASKLGVIRVAGSTSGNVTIQPAAAAGTWTFVWPTGAGTSGQQLTTTVSGTTATTSWTAASSTRDTKNIDGVAVPADALAQILNTTIYDFHYKPGMGTGDSQTQYVGLMADEAPWAMHYDGKIINPVNTMGYMVLGVRALNDKIEQVAASQGQNLTFSTEGELAINGDNGNYTVTDNGTTLTTIVGASKVVFAKVTAGLTTTKELVVQKSATIADLSVNNVTIAGQSLQDYVNNLIQQQLQTTSLPANSVASDFTVDGDATISGQLDVDRIEAATVSAETIASSDITTTNLTATTSALGDLLANTATVSGDLTVAQDASVAGTLTAGTIDATSSRFQTLESRMAELESIKAQSADLVNATVSGTLYANDIANFDDKVAKSLQQPTLLQLLTNQKPEQPEAASPASIYEPVETAGYQSVNPDLQATDSAILSLDETDVVLGASAVFVEKYLEVNGPAYVAQNLGVGNALKVGNSLVITNGTIDYHPAGNDAPVLALQSSGLGKLDFLAGAMTVEKGQVAITGDLTIAGRTKTNTLLTNLIQPADFGNPLQVQVAGVSTQSGEIKKSRFEIINETGQAVASFDADGNASFSGTLSVANQNLTTADIANDTVTTDKSSGQAKLNANKTQLTIETPKATPDSLIYVTPKGSTDNKVIYIKSQENGKFTVGLDQAVGNDIPFNWWIVN